MRTQLLAPIIGGIVVSMATTGCNQSLQQDPDAMVRRLAENWPPYRAPALPQAMMPPAQGPPTPTRSPVAHAVLSPPATTQHSSAPSPHSLGSGPVAASPSPPVRWVEQWDLTETAVDSLGRIGAPAVPVLVEALSDAEVTNRLQAARVLTRIGPDAKQSVDALVVALSDDNEDVRKAAARALGQIGPDAEEAVLPLMQIIEDPRNRPASAPTPPSQRNSMVPLDTA